MQPPNRLSPTNKTLAKIPRQDRLRRTTGAGLWASWRAGGTAHCLLELPAQVVGTGFLSEDSRGEHLTASQTSPCPVCPRPPPFPSTPFQEGELAIPTWACGSQGAIPCRLLAQPGLPSIVNVLLHRAAGDRKGTRNPCQAPSQGQRLLRRFRCSQEKLLLKVVGDQARQGHRAGGVDTPSGAGGLPSLQRAGFCREEARRRLVQGAACVSWTAAGRGGADQRTALQVTGHRDDDGVDTQACSCSAEQGPRQGLCSQSGWSWRLWARDR